MAGHTKGPWKVGGEGQVVPDRPGKRNCYRLPICEGVLSQADAALIAAAPELLDVCKTIALGFAVWAHDAEQALTHTTDRAEGERLCKQAVEFRARRRQVQAAIAKAEGKEGEAA